MSQKSIRGYELRDQIGSGGFGAVYRAYQGVVDREVAIKIILPEHANQPQFIRSFETEAQLVARLEHPYIVPLYDFWRDPDGAFLVMRWLRGGNLTALLGEAPLSLERSISILDQITSALSAAHRNDVVHRDLKPDNILLDEEGNAYLTDFGIAKATGHQSTDEGISGSLRYIAPEQLRGLPPDPQVDIYSLGLMLYEMLTGEHPFEGVPATGLIQSHLHDPVPDVTTKRDDLSYEVDEIIQKATAKEPDERYDNVRQLSVDLRQVLIPSTTIEQLDLGWDDNEIVNPYKGLRAFQEADAADFFGRDALVARLIARLREDVKYQRFLAVVGPSGSGKSSAVRAGLIPSLWTNTITNSDSWFVTDMVPSVHPLRQLESALMRVATTPPAQLYEMLTANENGLLWASQVVLSGVDGDLLLFIDQFEELFTLTESDEERDHFLDLLRVAVTAPDSRLRVVIAMRADFTDRPLQYPEFGELLKERTEFVLPLSADELGRAISGPANRVGVQVDADLIAAMVSDIREEPGALPLLQYALTEVFENRDGRNITIQAYHTTGGVLGALARRAEDVFLALENRQQVVATQTFLRLITLGEGKEDTRRRANISELMSVSQDPALLRTILDEFGRFRLLTFDSEPETREPTVEVAHEALIREWERLRGWLDVSRDDVRRERLLAAATSEWEKASKDASYLLSGSRLIEYEEWLETTDIALTSNETTFLDASIKHREALKEQERQRQAHETELEKRAQNRLRIAVGVLAVGIVVALVLSLLAVNQSQAANANAQTSDANAVIAQERGTEIAGQVETVVAAQETALFEADNAATQENIANANALTSDANALDSQNNAATAEARSTQVAQQVDVAEAAQETALFEADNAATQENIANANALTSDANALNAQNNAATAEARGTEVAQQVDVAEAAEGTALAEADRAATQENIAQANAATSDANEAIAQARGTEVAGQVETVSAAQGTAIFEADRASTQEILALNNAEISEANADLALSNAATAESALVISAESERLARAQALASGADQLLAIGNTDLALPLAIEAANLNPDLIQAQSVVNRIADVSPVLVVENTSQGYSNSRNVTGNLLTDRITGETSTTMDEVYIQNTNAVISPDSRYLATVDRNNIVYLWEIETRELVHRMSGHLDTINQIIFTPDGQFIVTASDDLSAVVWSVETGQEVHRLTGHDAAILAVAASPDSTLIATGGRAPTIIMWDVATGEQVWRTTTTTTSIRLRFSADGNTLYSWYSSIVRPEDIIGGIGGERSLERYLVSNGRLDNSNPETFYRGFSPDGQIAWTGGIRQLTTIDNGLRTTNQGAVTLYALDTPGVELLQLSGEYDWRIDSVRFVSISPDNTTLLVGIESYVESIVPAVGVIDFALDRFAGRIVLRLYSIDLATGTILNRYDTTNLPYLINDAVYFADNRTILSTTDDNHLILWDSETGVILRTIGVNDLEMTNLGLSSDERYALTYSPDGRARMWSTESIVTSEVQRIPYENIGSLAFSADDTQIYAEVGSNLVVIDRNSGSEIARHYLGNTINSVSFSPTEPRALASVKIFEAVDNANGIYRESNIGGQLLEINLETGDRLREIGSIENSIYTAYFSQDGSNTLIEFDLSNLNTRTQIQNLEPPPIRGILMNLEPFNIFWSCANVRAYARQGPCEQNPIPVPVKLVLDADIRSDIAVLMTYYVITASPELAPEVGLNEFGQRQRLVPSSPILESSIHISLMSLETGEEIRSYRGFNSRPTNVALSPDETLLLVSLASPENTIMLFDVESGEIIRRFVGHSQAVNDVVFSPDGLTSLSVSDDGTMILWDVNTGQIIRQFTGHNEAIIEVVFSNDGRSALSTDGTEIIEWQIETLEESITRVQDSRYVTQLNCVQREQYNVRPLCSEIESTPTSIPNPTMIPTSFLRIEVIATSATVRSAPSSNASVVGSLVRGDIATILEITEEWYKISLPDGSEGWVFRELVQQQ